MLYVINYLDEEISVSFYGEKSFETLKNKGENRWQYQDNFWNWFKNKISYDNEEISFIIITNSEFSIDKDILLSKQHYIINNRGILNNILSEIGNNQIYFYPEIEDEEFINETVEDTIKEVKTKVVPKGTLAEYFIKKTTKYKEDINER